MSPDDTHNTTAPESHLWLRVHRPEEYAADAIRFVARELRLPPMLVLPVAPLARRILASWQPAAEEVTQYDIFPCGRRRLRTVFRITNYSNQKFFQLIERLLKGLGIGRRLNVDEEVDFAWVLLGGVLNDYAERAGLRRETTKQLLDFRLRNSDYHTMTTWFPNCVEIANLDTGKVNYLPLPAPEIDLIVNYALNLQRSLLGKNVHAHNPDSEEMRSFHECIRAYSALLENCPPPDTGY